MLLTPINEISHSKEALIFMYKNLRLNLAQCVCTGYMGSRILSFTYKIMNSWYFVWSKLYLSILKPRTHMHAGAQIYAE